MYMKSFGAIAATAVMLTAAPALAVTVVFDDFSLDQGPAVDDPYAGVFNTSSTGFGAGDRDLAITQTDATPGTEVGASTLQVAGGSLTFSTNDGVTARATLTYTNVGDIDLGPNPFFFFDVGTFDNIADFSVTATDTSANVSTYSEVLAPGFSPTLFFSQFAGTADFNSLDTLSFMIDTTNVPAIPGLFAGGPVYSVDGSLNSISIGAVPLPATGLLLFGALGGVAALRRRKSRKAA